MKQQEIQLNTNLVPLFHGTYESIWEVSEYNEEGTEELAVEYNQKDLMQSITDAYKRNQKDILSEIGISFITALQFTGTFDSPRYYNFSTDTLDFTITVDRELLSKTLIKIKDNKDFEQFLYDKYTSYDGFISFTPNNYPELVNEIENEGDKFEQAIGALITYLMEKEFKDRGMENTIEMDVYEDWQGNGYEGLQYTIVQ